MCNNNLWDYFGAMWGITLRGEDAEFKDFTSDEDIKIIKIHTEDLNKFQEDWDNVVDKLTELMGRIELDLDL
jgi:hypothetical protein